MLLPMLIMELKILLAVFLWFCNARRGTACSCHSTCGILALSVPSYESGGYLFQRRRAVAVIAWCGGVTAGRSGASGVWTTGWPQSLETSTKLNFVPQPQAILVTLLRVSWHSLVTFRHPPPHFVTTKPNVSAPKLILFLFGGWWVRCRLAFQVLTSVWTMLWLTRPPGGTISRPRLCSATLTLDLAKCDYGNAVWLCSRL